MTRAPLLLIALLTPTVVLGQVHLQPGAARPGDLVLVTVRGASEAPTGTLGTRPLRFLPIPDGHQALTGLKVELEATALSLLVQWPGEGAPAQQIEGSLEVTAADFPERTLSVAGRYISPPAKVKRWIARDRAAFARAFSQEVGPRLFHRNFDWPVRPRVTARFGDLRLFNGKKQSQHFGTDLDGRTGDPIFASNDGVVVLSRECYASGHTVLLYHGAGLYTAYFHLSKRQVKEGVQVARGQLLGLVGKTGRVTGPHLHFGVKLEGMWLDPASLLRLDFE